MKGKNYYYSCVKPEESDAQTERFRALGARDGEIFIDTIGEKSSRRNNLRLLKQLTLREGDTLTVSSLYCLSDLKKGLADELHWLRDNGIQLRIADIPLSVQEHDEKSQQFLSDLSSAAKSRAKAFVRRRRKVCISAASRWNAARRSGR